MTELSPLEKIDYGATGDAAILQNARSALSTILGSCPLDRGAGYVPPVDAPINQAETGIYSEIVDWLETAVPDLEVSTIDYDYDPVSGKISPTVKVVKADGEV
jgi:hypothetical protein